jgi:predicted RNA-binding protein with PUA domain
MNNFIKKFLEEKNYDVRTLLTDLLEKKDHLINKIPSLSQEQKDEIIAHFQKFPHLEIR